MILLSQLQPQCFPRVKQMGSEPKGKEECIPRESRQTCKEIQVQEGQKIQEQVQEIYQLVPGKELFKEGYEQVPKKEVLKGQEIQEQVQKGQ